MYYSNEPQIDDLLAILKNEVHNRKNKNVDILHLSSNIVRRLMGEFLFKLALLPPQHVRYEIQLFVHKLLPLFVG